MTATEWALLAPIAAERGLSIPTDTLGEFVAMKAQPCPFYDAEAKGCTVYDSRPTNCRRFMCFRSDYTQPLEESPVPAVVYKNADFYLQYQQNQKRVMREWGIPHGWTR
jgi:Fe-S-cluster containining protein